MQSGNDKRSTELSNGQVAGISVASTTVVCVLVGFAISFWRMHRSQNNGFENLQSENGIISINGISNHNI